MTGPSVVRVNPANFATIDENVLTFTQAGTATITVQVGAERGSGEVTVTEP